MPPSYPADILDSGKGQEHNMTPTSEFLSAYGRASRHVMVALDGIRFTDPDAAALRRRSGSMRFGPRWRTVARFRLKPATASRRTSERSRRKTSWRPSGSQGGARSARARVPASRRACSRWPSAGYSSVMFPELQQIHRRAAPGSLSALRRGRARRAADSPGRDAAQLRPARPAPGSPGCSRSCARRSC